MPATAFKNKSPYILFLPFLLLYSLYVLYFHTDQMEGDEARYLQFAQNLLHGFYSPAYPNIDLINGPGYPILLMPFAAVKTPLICITLFNALLHYLSVVYLFKAIELLFNSFKTACIVALCWGCYFLAYQEMPCILTETFTLFLISAFSYQIIRIHKQETINYKHIILAGFTFGFLILTKVVFAYVLLPLLFISVYFYLKDRASITTQRLVYLFSTALLVLAPYLIYTWQLTGKFFYLSSESGKVLYWMTSLDENEYGDWNNNTFTANCHGKVFCNAPLIAANHAADIAQVNSMKTVIQADSVFKALAVQHIKSNPAKYARNWFANIGRLLFGFPASYYFQSPSTLIRVYVNSLLLFAAIFSLVVLAINRKNIPLEIIVLTSFCLIYLVLSSLVSAYPRQFTVIVPALLCWITYAVKNTVRMSLKIEK